MGRLEEGKEAGDAGAEDAEGEIGVGPDYEGDRSPCWLGLGVRRKWLIRERGKVQVMSS